MKLEKWGGEREKERQKKILRKLILGILHYSFYNTDSVNIQSCHHSSKQPMGDCWYKWKERGAIEVGRKTRGARQHVKSDGSGGKRGEERGACENDRRGGREEGKKACWTERKGRKV